jgi:hypothetical protein
VKPIEQMLGLGIEVELEVPDGIAAVREKGDLLVELVALGLGLHEGKTFAGDGLLGFFPAVKGQETLARDDLEETRFPLGFHVAAINPDGERALGHR